MKEKIRLSEITLEKTCGACPEQYDALYRGEIVGYLRLRWGNFTVRYPSSDGEVVYSAHPNGDGMFYSDERDEYLKSAKKAIRKQLRKERA